MFDIPFLLVVEEVSGDGLFLKSKKERDDL